MQGAEQRAYWLDGLRLIAASAVIAQHYVERSFAEAAGWFLVCGPGVFGVVLFFMISGYVIPLSVKNSLQPGRFFWRRALRILPLYWLVLLILIVLGWAGLAPFDQIQGFSWVDYLANLFLIFEYIRSPAALGVAWSLSLEWVWYAVFCCYYVIWPRQNAAQACQGMSLLLFSAALLSLVIDQRLPLGRIGMLNAAFYGFVFYGFHNGKITKGNLLKTAFIFFAAVWFSQWVAFGHFSHPNISLFSGLFAWSAALLFFSVTSLSNLMQNLWVWRHRAVIQLSAASYALYLLHEPISLLWQTAVDGWILIGVSTISTCCLSILIFHVFERPISQIERKPSATRRANFVHSFR